MDANLDIKLYRERWKAVKEMERYIPGKKYNLIRRLLVCLDILQDTDVEQMQIMLRWAKLKDIYEQQLSHNK
jgi:hypothetical protein